MTILGNIGGFLSGLLEALPSKILHGWEGRRWNIAVATIEDRRARAHFGRHPSYRAWVQELAALSQDVYQAAGKAAPPAPWTVHGEEPGPDGGYARIYLNPSSTQIVLAFRGSSNEGDWNEDALNAGDLPTQQGKWASALGVKEFAAAGHHLSFTGHSLGGSLAAIASLSTGMPATTFNAAGVGDGNYSIAQKARGAKVEEQNITNFSTVDDPLTHVQQDTGVRPAAGCHVTLKSNRDEPGDADADLVNVDPLAHLLSAFVWELA